LLHIIGFNHKSAPIAIRERLAEQDMLEWAKLQGTAAINEMVTLSTCNRTEFITVGEHAEQIKQWLANHTAANLEQYSYHYEDAAAIEHLLSVACGLDSLVLGEPQILGQIKGAFAKAAADGSIGHYLGHLFPFVFSVAKKVRSSTGICANSVSIAYTAVSLAKTIFTNLQNNSVLLIGAGETINLVAQHLYDIPVAKIFIANRTIEKGEALAHKLNGTAIRIGDIPDTLDKVDMVITSTASQLPIIGKGLLEAAIKKRKHKPIFIVDLAVPRDVEAQAGDLEDVYLYNIDDLQSVVQENLRHRELAAAQAKELITGEIKHFLDWQNSLKSVPTICAYRQKMESVRDQEIEKAKRTLQQGKSIDDVLERLGRDLTNKLMHAPTVEMRKAGYEGRFKLLDWAKQLLGI
jgi:glutamyl-tRNA reductase